MTDAATFSALAHELRLRIFRLLITRAPGGLPAGQIALRLAVPASTLSAHLKRLQDAGLLKSQRVQQQIVYAVDTDGTRALVGFLVDDCCGGQPELCGYGRTTDEPGAALPQRPSARRRGKRSGSGCC